MSSFLQKLKRQGEGEDEDGGFFDKNVEMVLEDALETIVEHYVEDAINFEGGEDDEDSPWYEWVLQCSRTPSRAPSSISSLRDC